MKKLIGYLFLFLLFFSSSLSANPQSQALVTQGRAVLFNNGSPSCSGILQAHGYFQNAVTEDPADQEARLFYALTTLAVSGLEYGIGPDIQTIRDFLAAFGIYRTTIDILSDGSVYTQPPESDGVYLPPETTPNGNQVHDFLDTAFSDLLDSVLDQLSQVTDDTINIILTPEETGDTQVEVDWGDVLLFNSAVKTLKGLVLTINAYNINDIDPAGLIQLEQADIFQIQRDLLDQYPGVLSLMSAGAGAASLTLAKDILISAVNDFDSAVTFITSEADSQMDDLFSFNEEDMLGVEKTLAYLTEAKGSILEDRTAEFDDETQSWDLIDESGRILHLYFNLDMGFLKNGSVYDDWSEPDAFGIERGTVTRLEINENTINIEIDGWGLGCSAIHLTFQGNLNIGKDTLNSGVWVKNFCGSFDSGSFTGTRTYLDEYSDNINLNAVFGSSTKAPLDLWAVRPEFNVLNDPVSGTFRAYPNPGDPVLNWILPEDIVTNPDAALEMDLQPQGWVTISEQSIVLNGSDADWPESTLVFTDITQENQYWQQSMDIQTAYLAKDSQYLYVAMKFANGSPFIPAQEWEQINYNLFLRTFPSNNNDRQLNISAGYDYTAGIWKVKVAEFQDGGWQERESYDTGSLAIGINFIEFRVPLSVIESRIGSLSGKYLTFKTAHNYNRFENWGRQDNNITLVQIDPGMDIAGSVLTETGVSGSIIIKLMSGPENIFMANTHVEGSGSYLFPLLASTDEGLVLTAFQDLDGNGILSFGEPWDMHTLPLLDSNQSINLDLTNLVDSDHDGVPDYLDAFPHDGTEWEDTDSDGIGDNADIDDDNDNMPDQFESDFGLDPKNNTGVNGADGDLDNDGFSNLYEYIHNSHPNDDQSVPDTDMDQDFDGLDLFNLILHYDPDCISDCLSDLNQDGVVDAADIAFLAQWFGR